jgi:uncharacterized protein YcfJ
MSPSSHSPTPRRIHPLVATAAVSVTVFALAGAAAVTGMIDSPFARETREATVVEPQVAAGPAPKVLDAVLPTARVNRPPRTTAPTAAAPAPVRTPTTVATAPTVAPPSPVAAAPAIDPNQATVLAIDRVEESGEGSGLGVIGGGIVGGALGNQVGGGNGRKAMTVLGAVGGAVAGNAIEKKVRSTVHYQVQVRMADGSARTLRYDQAPPFQPGDRIRVDAPAS